jgi:hypothetical protein
MVKTPLISGLNFQFQFPTIHALAEDASIGAAGKTSASVIRAIKHFHLDLDFSIALAWHRPAQLNGAGGQRIV